jgi:hypothetical protein
MKQPQDEVKSLDRQSRRAYAHVVKCAVIYGKQYALYQYAYWEDRIAYRLTKQFNKTVAHNIRKYKSTLSNPLSVLYS